MAVDRAALVQQALKGRGVAADGPVWPRYWARDPRAPAIPFDRAAASALLRASRRGCGRVHVPRAGQLLHPRTHGPARAAAVRRARRPRCGWNRCRPTTSTGASFRVEFDAVMLSILGGPSATVFHRFWHSAGETPRWNFWGYRNARVDAALDAALDAASDREFSEAIRRFETAVRDDPPAVFLAWNQTVQAVSRRFVVPADRRRARRDLRAQPLAAPPARGHGPVRTLRVRFAAMLATAAVVPLLTYGAVSVYSLREGTRRTVTDGNLNVARQVGEQVRRYISTNLQILHALAADLDNTGLSADQQDRIFKNYVLRFPEFRELTAFDAAGRPVGDQPHRRAGRRDSRRRRHRAVRRRACRRSSSTTTCCRRRSWPRPSAAPDAPAGWLVGEFSIEELWRLTDRIRVGASGYAMVVSPRRRPAGARQSRRSGRSVARGASLASDPVVVALRSASARDAGGAGAPRARPASRCWWWASACRISTGWCSSSSRRARRSPWRAATSATSSPPSAWRCSSCCSRAWSGAVRSFSRSASSSAAPRRSPTGTSTSASASGRSRNWAASATRSTGWRAASAISRRTCGGRSATRCSAAWPRAWSTICRTRSRTSRTTAASS